MKFIGCWIVALCILTSTVQAKELLVSWGKGAQPGADQHNTLVALDFAFYNFKRSARSSLSVGVSYMKFTTDTAANREIEVFSIYPQLTLRPKNPVMQDLFFFVRALGPSYISQNDLGEREQAKHFAFQAQVGIGYIWRKGDNKEFLLQLSWKHLSNANLFSDNDGIDLPFVLSTGFRF